MPGQKFDFWNIESNFRIFIKNGSIPRISGVHDSWTIDPYDHAPHRTTWFWCVDPWPRLNIYYFVVHCLMAETKFQFFKIYGKKSESNQWLDILKFSPFFNRSLSKISPSQQICFLCEYVIPCLNLKFKQQRDPFRLLYKTFAQHIPDSFEETFISPMHILSRSAVYFSFENGRSFGKAFPRSVLIYFASFLGLFTAIGHTAARWYNKTTACSVSCLDWVTLV